MTFTDYFEHSTCEPEIYLKWEESGSFVADANSSRPAFSISMPPPNATGSLHLGHGIMVAIQDLLIRWKRMAGYEVLWLPGTDHAAIASESRMIQELQAQGMKDPRNELGRDELVRRIAAFVESSRGTIRSQIRAMGASCDWTRERYTMEPQFVQAVSAVFTRMYLDGLIYRGPRIINWDPELKTTVSDDEIEHVQRTSKFYTIKYGPFLIGTSRPETKLGDTGVAVHPDDPRWKEYIGSTQVIEFPKGHVITVEVVPDAKNVDMETGTGAVGLTPAHSHLDFEIAREHNLPMIQIIDEDGKMMSSAGPYAGMTVTECREAFVKDLKEAGLLVKEEEYIQAVSICYRSKQPIEPLPKNQWFIDVNKPAVSWKGKFLSLRQILDDVVRSTDIELVPAYENKKYFHWVSNLHDWCISRQIWWGHRVPVWYRGKEECYFGVKEPAGEGWIQDTDTLDTWFSSALWTWATLIDPALKENTDLDLRQLLEKSADFKYFHPTSVMETGYDILFFWVARMIMMTAYMTGEVPFRTVYLHGLVLDKNGEKMSKSRPETTIDPLSEISENGADALRLALIQGSSAGQDSKLSKDQILASKRLVNKIWNAAKLVSFKVEGKKSNALPDNIQHPINQWILSRIHSVIEQTDKWLEVYNFNEAAETVRGAFWNDFCDFYLEAIKSESLAEREETPAVLIYAFDCFLRLFHPFIPFVTEQIWQELKLPGLLINASYPKTDSGYQGTTDNVDAVIRLISEIRRIRAEKNIDQKSKIKVKVQTKNFGKTFQDCEEVIQRMARTSEIDFDDSGSSLSASEEDATIAVDRDFTVAVFLGKVDISIEKSRLSKLIEAESKKLVVLEERLNNSQFLSRAKPAVVEATKQDALKINSTIASLQERFDLLNEN